MVRGSAQPGAGLAVLIAVSATAWAASFAPAGAADRPTPEIRELRCEAVDDRIDVSFRVRDAWSARHVERLQSGLPVTFRHRVELRVPRGLLLPGRIPARTVVETRVVYDALTKRYEVTRLVDTRRVEDGGSPPPPIEEVRSLEDLAAVRELTTSVDGVRLVVADAESVPEDAVVRVESSLGRRWIMLIVPTTIEAVGRCELEPR